MNSMENSSTAEEPSNGYISGFTLANFLQLINLEQKTCTLKVKSNHKIGYLHLIDGELVNAEADAMDGEQAATRIISWKNVQTEVQEICRTERKIHTPLMHILLNSTCHADENGDDLDAADLFEEAVRLAEGRHFKEAKLVLTSILKHDKRNYKAWQWFSRVSSSLKAIEGSLRNAVTLAPQDPEVLEEVKRFEQARSRLTDGSFPRCPFCWVPLEAADVECPICRCHLLIHPGFFDSDRLCSEKVTDNASERYNRVTAKEKNPQAHFWLGMLYLNIGNYDSALNQLDMASKLASQDHFYSLQLNILLKQMASSGSILSGQKRTTQNDADANALGSNEVIRKKVLVVEDSSTIRKVISITLRQKGFEIIEAGDGLEALSRLNDTKPDLILLDIILPKMDGYKILAIIRENTEFRDIPVIMLTSKDGIFNKMKGRVAGSSAYLTKPFDPAQLVETIERYIH